MTIPMKKKTYKQIMREYKIAKSMDMPSTDRPKRVKEDWEDCKHDIIIRVSDGEASAHCSKCELNHYAAYSLSLKEQLESLRKEYPNAKENL